MSELFTLDTLQEFWAKRPNGAKLQMRVDGRRSNWSLGGNCNPSLLSRIDNWRWEPQSKPVDLSPLVGSDVICFDEDGEYALLFADIRHSLLVGKWMAVDKDLYIPDGIDFSVFELNGTPKGFKLLMFNGLKEGYHWPWEDKS